MMHIHERIKAERIKKNLSEDDVAVKLNIPRSTYQYWETKTPGVEKVKAVAIALGLPENYFFVNKENDDENSGIYKPGNDHSTQVAGTIVSGKLVLVEAKDLTASFERIIEEKERVIKLIESQIEKAEKDKDRLFKALADAQKTINEGIKPIKEQTEEILSNSIELKENTMDAIIEMQSEHKAMMDTMDLAAKLPVGTTVGKADILEGAAQEIRGKDHKKKGAHKLRKG